MKSPGFALLWRVQAGAFAASVFQMLHDGHAAIFQRCNAVIAFKGFGEFALVSIAHLYGDLCNSKLRLCQKLRAFLHAGIAEKFGKIFAVLTAKIVFQAGFADAEFGAQFAGTVMAA